MKEAKNLLLRFTKVKNDVTQVKRRQTCNEKKVAQNSVDIKALQTENALLRSELETKVSKEDLHALVDRRMDQTVWYRLNTMEPALEEAKEDIAAQKAAFKAHQEQAKEQVKPEEDDDEDEAEEDEAEVTFPSYDVNCEFKCKACQRKCPEIGFKGRKQGVCELCAYLHHKTTKSNSLYYRTGDPVITAEHLLGEPHKCLYASHMSSPTV